MKELAWIAGIVAVVGLIVWYEVAVWNECRSTNSWLYCVRIISK